MFHAGFEQFSGGFIGVDVFFVISALPSITLLVTDMKTGQSSLRSSYERRAPRMLPTLPFVCIVSLPFAR